jgi:hypothetical protein
MTHIGMKAPLPLVPTPDLSPSFDKDAYFQPASWFYAAFGVLPRRESYQLASPEARQTVLDALADTHNLEQATVAHAVYLEKLGKPADIGHYALNLAPHLLLWFYDRGTYGDRGAHLFFSPQTGAKPLKQVRQLLAQHLETGQQERERIQVLRLSFGELEFSPLPINIPVLDLATHYNDDLLPAHDAILKRLQEPNEKGIVILHGPPGTGKTSYSRHLCGLTDKPKLFIPPNLAGRIADPEFINLLHDNTNSILIIEDADAGDGTIRVSLSSVLASPALAAAAATAGDYPVDPPAPTGAVRKLDAATVCEGDTVIAVATYRQEQPGSKRES